MKILTRFRMLPVLVLALVLAAGCEDLGLGSGGGAVTGLTIQDAGGGTLVTVGSGGSVSGSLTVPRNVTRALRVTLTGAGGVITPGIAESIRVTVTTPGVATWTETGQGTGTLQGVTAGPTSMRVDLISAGTAVYTSPSITVQVT